MHWFAWENFRSPGALARFLGTMVVGLSIDLWTKRLAEDHLKPTAREVELIGGWLHLKYTENPGAIFGLGAGYAWAFVLISIAAVIFLSWLFAASGRQRFYQFNLGLLMAGVLGNMVDRIAFGHVRDMIYALPRWPNVFPWIFNVADSLLCVGVGLMILHSFLHKPAAVRHAPESASN